MAVRRIFSITNYNGLSTDTKSTTAAIGSEFWEYNTKNTYKVYLITAGVSLWVLK